jgi:hypothetical protein
MLLSKIHQFTDDRFLFFIFLFRLCLDLFALSVLRRHFVALRLVLELAVLSFAH